MPELWSEISSRISHVTGKPLLPIKTSPVGGGCISEAWLLEGKNERYFVKTGNMPFDAEAAGLMAIGQAVRTPMPICLGECCGKCWLVLEYLEMGSSVLNYGLLGKDLANMHRITADAFGWETDNLIGSTPQINKKSEDWIEFWKTRRLDFQFDLAKKNGYDFG
ncbi:MAG TPA: fructosamine kinase family protein, partial [Burkholderiales bacterium]|nr:fructosamine kinase family protein [Burkholderiales bacterium]